MTTLTTQAQIDAMKSMCAELEKDGSVKAAHVDDWGRYGNFAVMVTPKQHDRHTTTRLKALVRKLLPRGSMLRQCFAPEAVREHFYRGYNPIVRYTRSYWTFDIDYMRYDAGSNTFS